MKTKHRFGRGEDVEISDLPVMGRTAPPLEDVIATSGVGYVLSDARLETQAGIVREIVHSESLKPNEAGDVWVTCPIGVVSHRCQQIRNLRIIRCSFKYSE